MLVTTFSGKVLRRQYNCYSQNLGLFLASSVSYTAPAVKMPENTPSGDTKAKKPSIMGTIFTVTSLIWILCEISFTLLALEHYADEVFAVYGGTGRHNQQGCFKSIISLLLQVLGGDGFSCHLCWFRFRTVTLCNNWSLLPNSNPKAQRNLVA